MSVSFEQTVVKNAAIALAALAMACGAEENAVQTGLPMQPVAQVQKTAPTTTSALNTPPVIDDVVLRPTSPRPGERVTAVVEASDAEADAIRFEFTWTVDGIGVRNTGAVFMLRDVEKHSSVEVTVVAYDPHGASEPYETSTTIANRPPVLRGVVFEPLGEVSVASDVTAAPRSFDPDGDNVTYEYVWRVDGNEASSDGAVLSRKNFKRGSEIVLEVVAYDGDDPSEPLISQPITVVNAKPHITSSPSGFGGEQFSYTLKVDDPDGDRSLRFHLAKGPDGMSVDHLSGKITWVPNSDQEGAHQVEVSVEDSQGGEDTQSFELTLAFEDDAVPAAADR